MGQHIAIFGAGRSGRAATRLAARAGDTAVCFDEAGAGDRQCFGRDDPAGFDAFVFSPGFAAGHPWRVLAEASGKCCQSELAYAAAHWQGELIGVTGTNGKTTVTRLLKKALLASGRRAVACGNIGLPMSEAVLDLAAGPETVAVVEISSFQAELPGRLELDGLLWTNFAEDHLDRYATMRDYLGAKANLLNCLKPGATAVFGAGIRGQLDAAGLLPPSFAADSTVDGGPPAGGIGPLGGAGSDRGRIDAEIEQGTGATATGMKGSGLSLGGPLSRLPHRHNFDLVASYWQQKRHPAAALLEAAAAFELSPHRLQRIAEKDGVCFWDDSKATNFEAALAAVAGLERPIIWIGGGRAKGGDVANFAGEIGGRIDAAVLYGEVADTLAANLPEALDPVRVRPQFEAAVHEAFAIGRRMSGAQVVLSPGFASFDQFSSYADRGKSFVSIVLGL
jgi:UDP-N-acetylmuramoylalanine--D-glutamate ligase